MFSIAQQYSGDIEIPNKTAEELYAKATKSLINNEKSFNDTILLEDPLIMKICAKGIRSIEYPCGKITTHMDINFLINLDLIDGKCKYEIHSANLQVIQGETFTYDQLKRRNTDEGLKEYYKEIGYNPWWLLFTKSPCKECIKIGKVAIGKVESKMQEEVNHLEQALKIN